MFENETKSWLLIYDNADNTDVDYSTLFSSGNGGCILMTTRNSASQEHGTVGYKEFANLGLEDSIKLLFRSSHIPEPSWDEHRLDA